MDARQHHLPGERLSLNYIQYGAKTLIAPGALERFYLVQIPLSGWVIIAHGAERYYSSPEVAAVLNPHLPTTMIWAESTRQVLIQIDRQAMQDYLSAQLGAPALRPLTFLGGFDLRSGAGAALRRMVLFLVAAADAGGATPPGFLRDQRLAHAHADLVAGAGSVTEVALRWRFAHLGQFAEVYRARFGLSPRDSFWAARGEGYQD